MMQSSSCVVADDVRCAADKNRVADNAGGKLGMHQKLCLRMLCFCRQHLFFGYRVMYRTAAVPEDDIFLRQLCPDKRTQVFVRNEQDILLGKLFNDL